MAKRKKHPMDEARDAALVIIGKIADRAVSVYANNDVRAERSDVIMDLTTVHFGGTKLRLDDLLTADDFNFIHDVAGINRHLDRETRELRDGFCPRFALPKRSRDVDERLRGESGFPDRFGHYPGSDNLGESAD